MPIRLILIKLQGKKPNMEPNEPFLSFEEKRENKLKKKRICERNRRTRIAEEKGRKKKNK